MYYLSFCLYWQCRHTWHLMHYMLWSFVSTVSTYIALKALHSLIFCIDSASTFWLITSLIFNGFSIWKKCGKLRISSFHLYQQCQHCQYILAHNFLYIQWIFNPKKILESSESVLFTYWHWQYILALNALEILWLASAVSTYIGLKRPWCSAF